MKKGAITNFIDYGIQHGAIVLDSTIDVQEFLARVTTSQRVNGPNGENPGYSSLIQKIARILKRVRVYGTVNKMQISGSNINASIIAGANSAAINQSVVQQHNVLNMGVGMQTPAQVVRECQRMFDAGQLCYKKNGVSAAVPAAVPAAAPPAASGLPATLLGRFGTDQQQPGHPTMPAGLPISNCTIAPVNIGRLKEVTEGLCRQPAVLYVKGGVAHEKDGPLNANNPTTLQRWAAMLKPIRNVDEARGIRLSKNESGDGGWFLRGFAMEVARTAILQPGAFKDTLTPLEDAVIDTIKAESGSGAQSANHFRDRGGSSGTAPQCEAVGIVYVVGGYLAYDP
jgi:hypothetical protein